MSYQELIDLANKHIRPSQQEVVKECLKKNNNILNIPMGFGKTLTAIKYFLTISNNQSDKYTIIVAKQNLITTTWVSEFNKFLNNKLQFDIVTSKDITSSYRPRPEAKVLIMAPSVLLKCYKKLKMDKYFCKKEIVHIYGNLTTEKVTYNRPTEPFLKNGPSNGPEFFYKTRFNCIIVDEVQSFSTATSQTCQSIAAICSDHRLILTGTLLPNPKPEKILGLMLILNDNIFPRSLPDAIEHLKTFQGLSRVVIKREPIKLDLVVNKHVIEHSIGPEEEKLYLSMKDTLNSLRLKLKEMKENHNTVGIRKFTSYILAMITYLLQTIVTPLIPLSNIALDIFDLNNKSEMSKILNEKFKALNIQDWLSDGKNIKSSRIKKVIEIIEKHRNEKLIVFTNYRTTSDLFKYILENETSKYKVLTLESHMSIEKRGRIIEEFNNGNDVSTTILLLTYKMGAEGLNLQTASTLLLLDLDWHATTTNQAIARIVRSGQKSKILNIYFFTSNTGIEKALYIKQNEKLLAADELMDGPQNTKIKTINVKEILQIIDMAENINMMKTVNKIK